MISCFFFLSGDKILIERQEAGGRLEGDSDPPLIEDHQIEDFGGGRGTQLGEAKSGATQGDSQSPLESAPRQALL